MAGLGTHGWLQEHARRCGRGLLHLNTSDLQANYQAYNALTWNCIVAVGGVNVTSQSQCSKSREEMWENPRACGGWSDRSAVGAKVVV